MFKKSLKLKLVAGALGLIVIVSIAMTVVVSMIVNRQNRTAVAKALENATSIVRDDLNERINKAASEIEQMAAANKIGPMVKFLSEFAEDELSISNNSYITVANVLLNQANSSHLVSLGIYDAKGRLQTFAVEHDKQYLRYGFYHQGTLHYSEAAIGAESAGDEWLQTQNWNDIGIRQKFAGAPPNEKGVKFVPAGDKIAIRVQMPVVAQDYDANGNEITKFFGMIDAIELLEEQVVSRLSRLTGMSVNFYVRERFSIGALPAYGIIETANFTKQGSGAWDIEKQAAYISEKSLNDRTYFQSALPIYGGDQYAGAVVVMQSDEVVKANNRQMIAILAVAGLVCLVLCAPLAVMVSGTIVRQIFGIVARLKDIAEGDGDLTKRLEVKSSDEIGQLADWFNAFIGNIHSIISQIRENSEKLSSSSADLSNIAQLMADSSTQTTAKSKVVANSGNKMSTNMKSAATVMEEAANKVQVVAAAAEELNATISQITRNTSEACEITSQAVDQAKSATHQVSELGTAATEIGKVIDAITDISDQVNLLALNATIESARAGVAGKGFAVVANEIKELARQTAEATYEIRAKVEGIQNSTEGTINEIESITRVVNKVNHIVTDIAGAVEEQSITTGSIAENIQRAAGGIGDVSQNVSESSFVAVRIAEGIDEITDASGEISDNSSQVKLNAKDLSELADKLKAMVNQFKV